MARFGESPSFSGTVYCSTSWDPDGGGPAREQFIVGGAFDGYSGAFEENIRLWDGQRWLGMATGLTGPGTAQVNAVATWDPDGDGPRPREVVAAGTFTKAGPLAGAETMNYVARWDGTAWRTLGSGLGGPSPVFASCLTEWDPDGAGPATPLMIVGGRFNSAGGVAARNIAAWDGTMWRPVGVGMESAVSALTTWDPDGPGGGSPRLVAGGPSRTGSGETVDGVALWDGSAWTGCGAGLGIATVHTMTSWDIDGVGGTAPVLVVGGVFQTAGEVQVNHLAIWNGQAWAGVGGGVSTGAPVTVYAVREWTASDGGPSRLVVAGNFGRAGGIDADCIAAWDGASWTAFADGSPIVVRSLSMFDSDGTGPGGPVLTAAGRLRLGTFNESESVATWSGTDWRPVSSGLSGTANALTTWDPDGPGGEAAQVVVAGRFAHAGSERVNGIARWDGVTWNAIGEGVDGEVKTVLSWPEEGGAGSLYAGGYFTLAGGGHGLARWDGLAWQLVGAELSDPPYPPVVSAMTRWDPDGDGGQDPLLIVGGEFERAGELTVHNIAAWDGESWRALGDGLGSSVKALTVWDPDGPGPGAGQLIAAGSFTSSGAASVKYLARWTGTQWIGMTPALNSAALAVTTWDPDGAGPLSDLLVVGGEFVQAGSVVLNGIGAWDGISWRKLGSGLSGAPTGYQRVVNSLAAWSPIVGETHQLVAGGIFTHAGGVAVNSVAAWNGASWRALGGGIGSFPNATSLMSVPAADGKTGYRDLIVGGQFLSVAGMRAGRLAAWSESSCCRADVNGDGVVDFTDYLEFLNLYEALDPAIDFNHDGVIDFADYLEFLNLYDAGC